MAVRQLDLEPVLPEEEQSTAEMREFIRGFLVPFDRLVQRVAETHGLTADELAGRVASGQLPGSHQKGGNGDAD